MNLAVYFPEAARLEGIFQVTEHPLESDCIVRQRIGHIMPARRDVWWSFGAKSDLDQIAQEAALACARYGLPWLDEHASLEGAIEFSRSRKLLHWAAIFFLLLENREEARRHLAKAILQASQNPDFQSRLEDWGRIHGLRP